MDISSVYFTPVQSVNFLPLFHYLNVLGEIFYMEKLLTRKNRKEPFLIINAFYEHINNTKNEEATKRELVQKLLEGTDLYGGNKSEILDMKYVDDTLDYIVSSVVFSQNDNLYGYLSSIVSTSTDLKLSAFKKSVFEQLSYQRHLNEDGEVSCLTELSRAKIAETIIWPLFPEPVHDMTIINIQYIYALAGLKFAQTAQMNLTNSFHEYVTLAMTVETSAIGKKISESILQIFALPAMIYYAWKEKEKFNQRTIKYLIKDEDFWTDVFFTLFTDLNSAFEAVHQTNSLYQFHIVMSEFINRTVMARDLLHKYCNLNETESLIDDYKTYSASTRCPNGIKLPNLEFAYDAQLSLIREKYRLMEIDLIRTAFNEFPHMRDLINSPLTTVYRSEPKPYGAFCNMCPPVSPSYKANINFFALENQEQIEFFALERNENNVTLLFEKGQKSKFNNFVGLPEERSLQISMVMDRFKKVGENFDVFVEKVTEKKADNFKKLLFAYGYDKTSMEKFYEIIEAFIPFYHCIKYANAGEQGLAAISCFGDVVTLIPFTGFFQIGYKISTTTINRFLLATEISLRTYCLRQAMLRTMTVGLRNAATDLGDIFSKIVFTKQMFKSLSISVIRALDPGFELVGRLTLRAKALIGGIIKHYKGISKRLPSLKSAKFETISQHLTMKSTDNLELSLLESKIEGRDVFRFIYRKEPYGPKCVRLSKGYAELRQVIGFEKETPVVISKVSKRGKVFYRKINLQTEKAFGLEMKLNKHGQLENVRQPLRHHLYMIKTEGFGGRGALMIKRERSIMNAANLVANANIGVSKQKAELTLRHYVLEVHNPEITEDIVDLGIEVENFGNIEVQDFIKEHIIGTDGNFIVDPTLNKYLPVPTYHEFALDWIRTQQINHIYNEFYVTNPKDLENLMYSSRMMFSANYNIKEINNKLAALYGRNFKEIDIKTSFETYISKKVFEHSTFEDYYAILVWRLYGYSNIKNPIISKLVEKSLYKLAIRQASQESSGMSSKILFHLEIRNPVTIEQNLSQLHGLNTWAHRIHFSTSEEEIYKELLELDFYKHNAGEKHEIFMYEVHIDSSYLAVDLNDLSLLKNRNVLIPEIPYVIFTAEKKKIISCDVNYIVMHNRPISKETVISKLMNKINKDNE
ncbi:uncharacterized protein LOC127288984 [Leptopilina boulardi]|uniref:uncharacterized protein LOC127288984 n=1 Tax=Leptopilina boulardi TaxID=63433 RepID=UPI0021F69ABC|nr:uncharacterized protein LOC127288984 [Leptopilina boulardi]